MIRNIIFDLGGVILNIDFERSATAFKNLGIDDFDQLYSKAVQNDLFSDLEMGKISAEDFRNELRKLSNLPLSDEQIDHAWNAIILDFPPERLALLQNIRLNYRCFLLSNTNKIHYNVYQADLRNNHGIDGLESLFEKAYFSHDLGLRKPNANIFEYVINRHHLKLEETLFVDDSMQNIEAAEALGLQTLYIDLNKNQEISDFFSNEEM